MLNFNITRDAEDLRFPIGPYHPPFSVRTSKTLRVYKRRCIEIKGIISIQIEKPLGDEREREISHEQRKCEQDEEGWQ